jgi:hydrogenase expression/formation protein HypD
MRFVDEFRDPQAADALVKAIRRTVTRPWTLMEVCGGQTHSIVRFGIDQLLPGSLTLVHGPGCPVCVTPIEQIDRAIALARRSDVVLCSYGDMLRVPGSGTDMLAERAAGADVRIVYSPMDALAIAQKTPDKQVVFFAVGFETTAPPNAMAVFQARAMGVPNFSVLVSHVLVPPAIGAVLDDPDCLVNGFLAAGHVCTIMGCGEYEPIARERGVPIVVTGFEPVDILAGILRCVGMLESGEIGVANQYARMVRHEGNPSAQRLCAQVFETVDRKWRGLGSIPQSGWDLRDEYADYDAARRFGLLAMTADEPAECLSGLVLQGRLKPSDCPMFGTVCTPERPLGATMVSSEGACAAYFRYRRRTGVSE